jgi:HlyD family secretion protein
MRLPHKSSVPGTTRPPHTPGGPQLRLVKHRRKRPSPRAALALLAVVIVLAGALAARDRTVRPAPRTCATALVARVPLSGKLTTTGRLSPTSSVRVGSELPGRVVAVYAAPGDAVTRGQVLARVDDADQRAAVAGAQAQVMSAGVLGVRAERQLDELLQSWREQGLLPRDLDPDELADGALGDVQLDLLAATAQTAKQQAALALARAQLARRAIRAPVDGVVLSRSADVGELVATGPTAAPLFVVADVTRLRLEADIDARHVAGVRPGAAAFTTPAHGGFRFSAVVRQVAVVDEPSHNRGGYVAVLDVANADGALRPGFVATVEVPIVSLAPTLQVPPAAVRDGRVWLPDAYGRPMPVPIEVGVVSDDMVEISGPGVAAGEVVVSDAAPAACVVRAPATRNQSP